MGSRFITSFLVSLLLVIALAGGAGYAITVLVVPEPRERYRLGQFDFELAPGWTCDLDGTEHVCQAAGDRKKGAIAVIAVKPRNDQDTLEVYEAHLKNPQQVSFQGEAWVSEMKFVKRRLIGGREWVTSLHVGSEIKNFETYYLGTVTSHFGMLVTMSAHKDRSAEYAKDFEEMMATLNVYQR